MEPYRIELPTPFNVGTVNAYLFTTPEPVLVDTGVSSPESWAALLTGLGAHGLRVGDLTKVVITHAHVDHFGQAAQILAQSDAQLLVSTLSAPWLHTPRAMWQRRLEYYKSEFLPKAGLPPEPIQLILTYMKHSRDGSHSVPVERTKQFSVDSTIQMGGNAWKVLHFPGHASHQTCFWEPESGRFIAGDMLLPKTPTPVVEAPPPGSAREPALPLFLESLAGCAALPMRTVYPGHGAPFTDHQTLITHQLERIRKRRDEALELVRQGEQTVPQLMEGMYGGRSIAVQFAGLWMLIGYLDLLLADKQILCEERHGVWHYFPR